MTNASCLKKVDCASTPELCSPVMHGVSPFDLSPKSTKNRSLYPVLGKSSRYGPTAWEPPMWVGAFPCHPKTSERTLLQTSLSFEVVFPVPCPLFHGPAGGKTARRQRRPRGLDLRRYEGERCWFGGLGAGDARADKHRDLRAPADQRYYPVLLAVKFCQQFWLGQKSVLTQS